MTLKPGRELLCCLPWQISVFQTCSTRSLSLNPDNLNLTKMITTGSSIVKRKLVNSSPYGYGYHLQSRALLPLSLVSSWRGLRGRSSAAAFAWSEVKEVNQQPPISKWKGRNKGHSFKNKHWEILVSCSDDERNCMQAQGTACKLKELHASSCNCMQAYVTACKLK